MVEAVVQAAASEAKLRVNLKEVRASRGKVIRAEPIAALYEQGKVHHVGGFPQLEDQLAAFTTLGYMGDGSPDRADALIWGLTEIFPRVVSSGSENWQRTTRSGRDRPQFANVGYGAHKRRLRRSGGRLDDLMKPTRMVLRKARRRSGSGTASCARPSSRPRTAHAQAAGGALRPGRATASVRRRVVCRHEAASSALGFVASKLRCVS